MTAERHRPPQALSRSRTGKGWFKKMRRRKCYGGA
jgi:hypothetical protein